MNTAQLVPIILAVGTFLPLLTALAQQPQWSARTRTVIGVAVSVVAGVVTYVSTNGLDVDNPGKLVTVVLGIVLAASASYRTIWKPAAVAPKIERATSPSNPATSPNPNDVDDVPESQLPDGYVPEDTPTGLEQPDGFDDGTAAR